MQGTGMVGGMHGGGMHGGMRGRFGAPRASQGKAADKQAALEDRLDENDTKAYLDAEENVLTEKQKERAREIASDYREQLYEQREKERATSPSTK